MADIISLDNKLKLSKAQQAELDRKRKLLAVQKVFQCTHCTLKCEKCGIQLNRDPSTNPKVPGGRLPTTPYRFCKSCGEEYLDYIERLKGGGDAACYWRNDAWMAAWQGWISYQAAIDRYLKSKEFLQLLQEIKHPRPDA